MLHIQRHIDCIGQLAFHKTKAHISVIVDTGAKHGTLDLRLRQRKIECGSGGFLRVKAGAHFDLHYTALVAVFGEVPPVIS